MYRRGLETEIAQYRWHIVEAGNKSDTRSTAGREFSKLGNEPLQLRVVYLPVHRSGHSLGGRPDKDERHFALAGKV